MRQSAFATELKAIYVGKLFVPTTDFEENFSVIAGISRVSVSEQPEQVLFLSPATPTAAGFTTSHSPKLWV